MPQKNQHQRSVLPKPAQADMRAIPQLNLVIGDLGYIQVHGRFLSSLMGAAAIRMQTKAPRFSMSPNRKNRMVQC
jgi:hypothetical protein